MNVRKDTSRVILLAVIGIVLLAAYLRLWRISEYMTFLGDEGRDMLVIKRMIVDHRFTLLGPTASVGGFFLGPIYYYFMLPFVWISGMNPAGAAVMVALFGIATVFLVYRAGRDWFGTRAGLAAAALYALSPVVIAYSRSSWNPNLVPFFSLWAMYSLWTSTERNRPRLLFVTGLAFGIGLQLHYLFLFLLPVAVLWILVKGRKTFRIAEYGLGLLGLGIGYGPFLLFELRHGFPNSIAIWRFLQEGQGTGFVFDLFKKNISDVTYRLFGRLLFRLPPPEQWVNLMPWQQRAWVWATVTGIVTSLFVTVMTAMGSVRSKAKRLPAAVSASQLLLAWFAVPVMLFGLYKKGIYDYYFGIFFPLPFLLTGYLLARLSRRPIGAVLAALAFAALAIFNWEGRPYKFPPNNQLAQARSIAEAALDKTHGKPFNFALLATHNSDHAYRFFFEAWGRAPVTIENPDIDPARSTVTDQLIIICELDQCNPLGNPLWEIAGFGRAEVAGEWRTSFVKIFRLVHYRETQ